MRSLYRTVVTKRAEPQGKALDLPVDLRSYPHLWSSGLGDDRKDDIAGTSGRDEFSAPLLRKESA